RGDRAAVVDRRAGFLHESSQRLDSSWPQVFLAHRSRRCARLLVGLAVAQQRFERCDPAICVSRCEGAPEPTALDELAEHVAAGRDDGQAGPEAVEQPGAKREPALEVVEVRRDTDVRLEEVRAPLLVRDPTLVEEDDAVAEAELFG